MKKIFLISVLILCVTALYACGTEVPVSEEGLTPEENASSGADNGDGADGAAENSGDNDDESSGENGDNTGENVKEPPAVYVRSLVDGLNVRSGAGVSYPSLGALDRGDMTAYIAEENGFYRTLYRGRTAYVSAKETLSELFSLPASDAAAEAVIDEGLKLLGTPYVYGATRFHSGGGKLLAGFDEGKYDCSSLMQYIFYKGAGVLLDVTTRTQILQGEKVSEIRRGDLMFFTNASRKNYTGIERVGHVALYLGGNYILHTASDHAVIEEISPLRHSYFIQANRYL